VATSRAEIQTERKGSIKKWAKVVDSRFGTKSEAEEEEEVRLLRRMGKGGGRWAMNERDEIVMKMEAE
jgi:hypothetical protein